MNIYGTELCTPAYVYLILSIVISLIEFLTGLDFLRLIVQVIVAGLLTFFLNWVCEKASPTAAWIIFAIPIVIGIIMGMNTQRDL